MLPLQMTRRMKTLMLMTTLLQRCCYKDVVEAL